MYYIGLDVHKNEISYCVKDGSGELYAEGYCRHTKLHGSDRDPRAATHPALSELAGSPDGADEN
jgi:hypothetical protein